MIYRQSAGSQRASSRGERIEVDDDRPTHADDTSRVWYLRTGEDTDGEVHEQRVEYVPGSPFPPTHLHPGQDEHFEVERGQMLFVVDGVEHLVSAGGTIDIPRGTPHRARNASTSASAVVRWETRPALRTTAFFSTAARLGDDMGLLDSALLAHEYRDVFRLTGPTRLLVPIVAGLARLARRSLPTTGGRRLRRVEVEPGVSVPYTDQGASDGATLVLIHGLGDSLRSYEPVQAHLPESVRTLVPSLRGHGDADRPDRGYTPADHVEDIRAVLDDAGVADAVVGGHSSGSQIAQLFALTYPERTRGLVLIGAPGPHPDPGAAARMSSEVDALQDPIDERWLRDFAESTVAGPVPDGFLDVIVAEGSKVPARVYQAAWPGIREFDVSADLHRITVPTLLVWGDQDAVPVATRSAQEQLSEAIPNARLLIYAGAGHSPHWERPERFASDLAAFVGAR
jgi:non-heme chloroperoxidase